MVLTHSVQVQLAALVAALMDLVRTAGVVLLVLALQDMTPVPVWAGVAMSFAPNLFGFLAVAVNYARHRYVTWRVAREVR